MHPQHPIHTRVDGESRNLQIIIEILIVRIIITSQNKGDAGADMKTLDYSNLVGRVSFLGLNGLSKAAGLAGLAGLIVVTWLARLAKLARGLWGRLRSWTCWISTS